MSTKKKSALTLQLDSEAVRVFESISDTDKDNLEMLVSCLFKDYQKSSIESFRKITHFKQLCARFETGDNGVIKGKYRNYYDHRHGKIQCGSFHYCRQIH